MVRIHQQGTSLNWPCRAVTDAADATGHAAEDLRQNGCFREGSNHDGDSQWFTFFGSVQYRMSPLLQFAFQLNDGAELDRWAGNSEIWGKNHLGHSEKTSKNMFYLFRDHYVVCLKVDYSKILMFDHHWHCENGPKLGWYTPFSDPQAGGFKYFWLIHHDLRWWCK